MRLDCARRDKSDSTLQSYTFKMRLDCARRDKSDSILQSDIFKMRLDCARRDKTKSHCISCQIVVLKCQIERTPLSNRAQSRFFILKELANCVSTALDVTKATRFFNPIYLKCVSTSLNVTKRNHTESVVKSSYSNFKLSVLHCQIERSRDSLF